MAVTLSGISMLFKTLQFSNAYNPIPSRFSDNFTVFSELQYPNACPWISVTLSGICIPVRLIHPPNAPLSITVTVSGIVICSIPVQPANNPSAISVVPSSNVTVFKFAQPSNAPPSMLALFTPYRHSSKLFGISISVNLLSFRNTFHPIVFKFFDNVTLDNSVHSANAFPSISVTLSGITIFFNEVHEWNINCLITVNFSFTGKYTLASLLHFWNA